jgi:hypothetical protein
MKFPMLGISPQKRSRMPFPGCPIFEHFHSISFPPPPAQFPWLPPQPSERVILLALTSLKYRGTSQYLDNLAARIDAPRLGNIDITFFSQPLPMEPLAILANLSTGLQCRSHIVEQTFYSLSMPSPSPLPNQSRLRALSCKFLAVIFSAAVIHGSDLQWFIFFPFWYRTSTRLYDATNKWARLQRPVKNGRIFYVFSEVQNGLMSLAATRQISYLLCNVK